MLIVENIEQLLKNFFALHHPRQVKKVSDIAREFKGQEIELLKAICVKYKKDHSIFPGLVDALSAPAPVVEVEEPIAQLEESEEEEKEEEKVIAEESVTSEVSEEATEEEENEEEKSEA